MLFLLDALTVGCLTGRPDTKEGATEACKAANLEEEAN